VKKKARQVRRGTVKQGPDAKAKVTKAQLPPEQPIPEPASVSPSSAWLEMMVAGDGLHDTSLPSPAVVHRREAGPGMPPGRGYEERERESLSAPPVVVVRSNGICEGCLEPIVQDSDHEWWCPWWDTPEGKRVVPF